jgi:ATP-binding cassette subfamily B protein
MTSTADVRALLWPAARKDELAHALARAADVSRPASPAWFQLHYEDLAPDGAASRRARDVAPAFLQVEDGGDGAPGGLLAVLAWSSAEVRVLAPDGAVAHVPVAAVVALLRARADARVAPGLDRVVASAGLSGARATSVRGALVGAALAGEPVVEGWRVRAASGSFAASLRAAGLARRLALTALAYGAELSLLVVAWWMVGARATRGGSGTALGWLAVLAAFVAARFVASWAAGRLALDGGRLLRARLMDGLLALDAEPLRAEGIGQLLGRVMETEAVESLALGGGLLAVAGLFELATGAVVLALGARGAVALAFLSLALVVGVVLARRFWRLLGRWSTLRLALTHDLVERMAGHRTLVAQQPPELRHVGEDHALAAYERAGRALDRTAAALAVLVPRGWLFAGVVALAPALVTLTGKGGLVAASLGGVLFVHGALRKLTQAFPALATAAVAWQQVAPLLASAPPAAAPPLPSPAPTPTPTPTPTFAAPLVAARALGYRHPGRDRPVLADCSFEIRRGDRILLEGPSGGGKSTLASLVAGLRAPDAGELALDGVSHATLGLPRWRERVGVVPQFHENHVFSASVLFNLLLGRAWPPRREDVAEAEAICRELDLEGVLARMPSGLDQLVGDSGWQLSHGERSRLFIARALLQRLDVRVLDESFAALDPETLERVLACVLSRAKTLLVIAHP